MSAKAVRLLGELLRGGESALGSGGDDPANRNAVAPEQPCPDADGFDSPTSPTIYL